MSAVYQRCDDSVSAMAMQLINQFHPELKEAGVTIDFVFAFAPTDDSGERTGPALTKNGVRALGLCRVIGPKDRALGRRDAEIALDADEWGDMTEAKQRALLDHELYHLIVRREPHGAFKFDDQHRPLLKLRPHDIEFGWFKAIADRHAEASQEQMQAKRIYDAFGQSFFPQLMDLFSNEVKVPNLPSDCTVTVEGSGKFADAVRKHFGKGKLPPIEEPAAT